MTIRQARTLQVALFSLPYFAIVWIMPLFGNPEKYWETIGFLHIAIACGAAFVAVLAYGSALGEWIKEQKERQGR
jgi:hypothetical protein